jgi:hypothetical protein
MWDFADNRSWLHPSIVDTPFIKLGQYGAPAPFSGGRGTPIIAKPAYYGLQWGLTGQSLSGKTGVRLSISNHWSAVPNYLKFDPDIDNLFEPQSGLISSAPAFNPTSASNWIVDGISNDQYRIRTLVNGKWYYLTRQAVLDGGTVVPTSTVYLDDLRREWINQRWYILPAGKGAFTIQSAWSSQSGFLTRSSRIEKGKEIPMDELYIGNGDRSLDSRRWILF